MEEAICHWKNASESSEFWEQICQSITCLPKMREERERMTEVDRLKAENAQLKRDQEFLFLVMDIGLSVIEKWADANGLLSSASENSDQDFSNRDNQVRVFLEQIRKADQDALINRLVGLVDLLKDR